MLVRVGTKRHLGILAAVLAALVFATPADAAITRVEVNETFTGNGTIKAPCPDGTNVISGGMGTFNGYGGILLLGSYPYDGSDKDKAPDDGWKVEVTNRGGLETASYALCSKQDWKYVSDDFKFPRFDVGTGTVACPSGTHLIAGGGRAGTLIGLLPDDDKDKGKTPDDGYLVRTESGASDRTKGTVYAICGKTKVSYVTTGTGPVGTHEETNEVDAPCPDGTNVLGGGAGMNVGHRDGAINSLFPRTDDKLEGWGAYLDNYDIAKTHTGKVVAVCTK